MKLKKITFIIAITCLTNVLSYGSSQDEGNADFLLSGTIGSAGKKLVDSVISYPATAAIPHSDGINHVAQQYPQTRKLRHTVPPNVQPVLKHGNFSTFRGHPSDYDNYPTGSTLFKKYPSLAAKFDTLINLIKKEPKFKAFFNKVHLNILNELYEYLMNIYTNFNVQHVGIKEVQTQSGASALQINIPLFLENEDEYEANKKTLIINHFINIIESQLNGKIRSIMPKVPHTFATSAGKTLIQNDFSVDLTHFIVKQIAPEMVHAKKLFLNGLVVYLSFFQELTSYLMQPHPTKPESFTAFVDIAISINQFLFGDEDPATTKSADKMQTVLAKMNPPFFTFNYDDIRALKLIPALAKSMKPNTKAIQWPSHIVEAANGVTYINGHPIAYFTDASGTVVKEDKAKHLYIVMQSGKNFFQEELRPQPAWLNNWSGIASVLRGCFGDFSALLGLDILDPCMEALVQNAVDTMNGKDVNETNSFSNVCQNLLDSYKANKTKAISPSDESKDLSSVAGLLPTPSASPTDINLSPTTSDLSSPPSNASDGLSLSPSSSNIDALSPTDEDSDISSALIQ